MKLYYSIVVIGLILLSCNQKKLGELSEYLVDTEQNISLLLSEITEEVAAVELELTDKSMINPDFIRRILIAENNIIIAESNVGGSSKILVFNKNGKFVHSIGAKGQGPGEFNVIQNIAFDESTKRLFIVNFGPNKIICYHLDGKFLKETRLDHEGFYPDINYINDELFLDCTSVQEAKHAKRILFRMNEYLQITDSIIRWENSFEQYYDSSLYLLDFIVKRNTSIYIRTISTG